MTSLSGRIREAVSLTDDLIELETKKLETLRQMRRALRRELDKAEYGETLPDSEVRLRQAQQRLLQIVHEYLPKAWPINNAAEDARINAQLAEAGVKLPDA